jgi:hypothetical protein
MPTDIEVLKRLAAAGIAIPAEVLEQVLAGPPEPGTPGADGVLRVTTAQIAPGSAWMREHKQEFVAALKANQVELVEG